MISGRLTTRRASAASLCLAILSVICLMNAPITCLAQSQITQLTHDGKSVSRYGRGWNADGRYILFSKDFKDSDKQSMQTWIMKSDGTDAKPISKVWWQEHVGWSPDGLKVAFIDTDNKAGSESGCSICIYDVVSGQTRPLTPTFKWGKQEGLVGRRHVSWSPDSKEFVILMMRSTEDANRAEAYLYNADTGESIGLSPNNYTTGGEYPCEWSQDSKLIYFISKSSPTAKSRLWVCNRDGTDLHPITPENRDVVSDPRLSPDGKLIAYCMRDLQYSVGDIWVCKLDGSEARQITHAYNADPTKCLDFWLPEWVDNRYMVASCLRLDANRRGYLNTSLIDLQTGKVDFIVGSDPDDDVRTNYYQRDVSLSPDRTKLAFIIREYDIRGKNTESVRYENERQILYSFSIPTREFTVVKQWRVKEDGWTLYKAYHWHPFWSPDSRQILFTQGKVISYEDAKYEPDLYIYSFPGPPVVPNTTENSPGPEQPQPTPDEAALPVPDIDTVLIRPVHRLAAEIARAMPDKYSSMYKVDAYLNAFMVSPRDSETLEAFRHDLGLIDQPPSQIMVDVLVTELSRDASKQLGLDWEFAKGRMKGKFPLLNGIDAGDVIYHGVGKLDDKFFVTLSALEEKGKVRVSANPRIIARCGTEATINIRRTDNFLYVSGTDTRGNPTRTRSDISADTILKICPQLLASGKISMTVDATVDNFLFAQKNDLPDTTRRQATTNVVVPDGETVIIGGLTLEEEMVKDQKTPVLSDLPVVGGLFNKTNSSKKESTLVIFVTPRLVSETTE